MGCLSINNILAQRGGQVKRLGCLGDLGGFLGYTPGYSGVLIVGGRLVIGRDEGMVGWHQVAFPLLAGLVEGLACGPDGLVGVKEVSLQRADCDDILAFDAATHAVGKAVGEDGRATEMGVATEAAGGFEQAILLALSEAVGVREDGAVCEFTLPSVEKSLGSRPRSVIVLAVLSFMVVLSMSE